MSEMLQKSRQSIATNLNLRMRVNFLQYTGEGVCFAHGPYKNADKSFGCPKWPACISDPQKAEFKAMAFAALPSEPAAKPEPARCAICGWPLALSADKGCVRGNCSMRPLPERAYDPARANAEYGRYFYKEPSGQGQPFMSAEEFWMSKPCDESQVWQDLRSYKEIFIFAEAYAAAKEKMK